MAQFKKKVLFQSNINHLLKVKTNLEWSHTMSGTFVILAMDNREKAKAAILAIDTAVSYLKSITKN